ncbi:oligosaccharide flippase family protein [Janthinobacterium sp. 78]|uniref:lipopolysaccharide biosynthesis protein n=1 Tax=Janthinobacterium sp. 78 TaxID=2135631 RepID=UPI000D5CA866|nr:oligosaccharide flippase family protein [Janthinobacterium sp. 78]PVX33546.1 O-antigen/teichoic acid export membrane protein [Janthinobacterium sp. 78]
MSLKKNILANYVSQIYVTLIGIVMIPMYLRYMGAEAYGLVGFFAMLQVWFQLLDMGLTPTMARATARFNGGASDALTLCRLLRALEGIFIGIAVLGAATMIAGSGVIASSWLKIQSLPLAEVQHSIMLIALIVALRWMCGLYRGVITGFERIVWLSGLNFGISTFRFVLVIPFFIYVGSSPVQFFSYQLAVTIAELLLLVLQTYRLLPKLESNHRLPWQWEPLRGVLKFSFSIAFTSSVWIFVTQTDKLLLSKLLPLSEYSYFTLSVLVAGGVGVISGPISAALSPRLTKLSAEGNEAGLIKLYRQATQLICIIAVPAALTLAFFGYEVLLAWTGDVLVAKKAAPILSFYALGNGILALAAFPYYLQFAKGDLKLHMYGNLLFVVVLIPCLIWATLQYGAIGAGYAWVVSNATYFLIWIPKVHRRFVKGLHTRWLFEDVIAIAFPVVIVSILIRTFFVWPEGRLELLVGILSVGVIFLIVALMASSLVRNTIRQKWQIFCTVKG